MIGVVYCLTSCAEYPVNPPKDPEPEKRVVVQHVETQYLPVTETGSGLITNKINLLTFRIIPEQIDCKALEFCGRTILCGPPVHEEHVLHFRTDQAINDTEDIDVQPNIIDHIQPDSAILLFRIKYPTNEYAPFEGDQGMVQSLDILDCWMIDEDEVRTPVPIVLEIH